MLAPPREELRWCLPYLDLLAKGFPEDQMGNNGDFDVIASSLTPPGIFGSGGHGISRSPD